MHTVLKLTHLRWTDHVIRMPDERLQRRTTGGKAPSGGQKKRYKDILKASLKDFEIPMASLEETAQEQSNGGEQLSMKTREYVKLKESAENTKRKMGL